MKMETGDELIPWTESSLCLDEAAKSMPLIWWFLKS